MARVSSPTLPAEGRAMQGYILLCIASVLFSLAARRVLLYCSDVSGAFDRVDVPRLLAELR
eukprot:4021266-Pyramimonas_sp.AAC.1